MRPGVTYEDLRNASGNTGNVEENKSLYWNPVIYKVLNQNGAKTYEVVDVWFASAYYIWRTGQAKAFPNGLKMRTSGAKLNWRAESECVGEHTCERTDAGGCQGYGPSNQEQSGFLPLMGCSGKLFLNVHYLCFKVSTIFVLRTGDEHNLPNMLGRCQLGVTGWPAARCLC